MSNSNPRGLDVNLRSGPQMLEYEQIADRIASEGLGRVLDWGCGWGQVSHLLHDRGVEVESFDYREGALPQTIALERYPEITAHVSGDPVELPFDDDRFDAVLSCGVLEHVQAPERSLTELHRVLRPGGRLYVYKLPNRFSYLELLARALGLYYHGKLADDRVYDRRRTIALLSRAGFAITSLRRANLLPLTVDHPLVARHAARIWRLNGGLARIPVLNLAATNIEADAVALPPPRA